MLRQDAIVVSLQNGVRTPEVLRRHLGQTVLAGIVDFNVLAKGRGVFRRATSGQLVIEASSDPRVASLVAELRAAGFEVDVPADIRGVTWSKLLYNLNNAVSALLRLPTPLVRLVARAQLRIDPEARSSMWEDLTRGRPTEIDFLDGEIVCLPEAHGAEAPFNQRVVEIVREAERAGTGSPKLSAEALWGRLTIAPRGR